MMNELFFMRNNQRYEKKRHYIKYYKKEQLNINNISMFNSKNKL